MARPNSQYRSASSSLTLMQEIFCCWSLDGNKNGGKEVLGKGNGGKGGKRTEMEKEKKILCCLDEKENKKRTY